MKIDSHQHFWKFLGTSFWPVKFLEGNTITTVPKIEAG